MKRMFVSMTGTMYRLGGGLRIDNFLHRVDEKDGADVDVTYYVDGYEVGFRVVQMGGEVTDA